MGIKSLAVFSENMSGRISFGRLLAKLQSDKQTMLSLSEEQNHGLAEKHDKKSKRRRGICVQIRATVLPGLQ